MREQAGNRAKPMSIGRYAVALLLGWTLLISGLLTWAINQGHHEMREMVRAQARTHFNKDQAFRFWGAAHGGVYVRVDEQTPPNPHLAHIPERDIVTPSGKRLTLMNPAYMIRQMMED